MAAEWEPDSDGYVRERALVNFYRSEVCIYGDQGFELKCRRITEMLQTNRRLSGRVPDPWWFTGIAFLWLGFSLGPVIAHRGLELTAWPSLMVSLVGLVGILVIASGRVRVRQNALFLQRQHEHERFLRRYAPDIIKAVISGTLGGVIGYVLRMLQEAATSSPPGTP